MIRFLHTHTLGLRQAPGSVAWESHRDRSRSPAPSLTWARGTHESPQGTITRRVAHRGRASCRITAEIPAGTAARVVFPDGTEHRIGPGAFEASAGCRGLPHPAAI